MKQLLLMSNEQYKEYLLSNTRTKLANLYGVNLTTFNGWIEINPTLKKILLPYTDLNKSVLPPKVIIQVIEVLGEP